MARRSPAVAPLRIESLRLEPGSHASPRQGVCIVELASILGEERFSDEPDCVCEVIGAYLRSWNDRTGYADRQRLLPYAERIVGTRGRRAVTHRRREICLVWAGIADFDGGPLSRALARIVARVRIAWLLGLRAALRLNRGAGEYAARVCHARHGSAASFRLLERLLEVGAPVAEPSVPPSLNENGNGNGHANGNGNGKASRDFVHAVLRAREGQAGAPASGRRARRSTRPTSM